MDSWITTFQGYVERFVDYFNSQAVPVQIMLVVVIVLCFVGAGFAIYGAIWLAYQAIKISIVGTIILVYVVIAGIVLLVTAFIDPERARLMAARAGDDIEWFWFKAYPPRNGHVPPRHAREEETTNVLGNVHSRELGPASSHFCTNCGGKFSAAMETVLKNQGKCHCEVCGHGFIVQQAVNPVLAH